MSLWRRSPIWLASPTMLAGIIIGVVGWGGFNTVLESTNRIEFCISCHEMRDTVYPEYLKSPHYRNASGVRATCPDCHVPRDWPHMVIRKIGASQELVATLLGTIDTPAKFAERRIDLARHEWRRMGESNSRECRNCHEYDAMDVHKQESKGAATMQAARAKGGTCIDCHKGIAHALPDMTARFRRMAATLADTAKVIDPQVGATVTTTTTTTLFLARPETDKAASDGEIAALTPLTVLESAGSWLRVRVEGWRRPGSDEKLFGADGQRIPVATMEETSAARVKTRTKASARPDQEWSTAALDAWIDRGTVTSDRAGLEAYVEEMYSATCAMCHALPDPTAYGANDWIGKSNAMKRFVPLSAPEFAQLQKWLQLKAGR